MSGVAVFAASALLYSYLSSKAPPPSPPPTKDSKKHVIFVLGGPGAGKGTVCERLVDPSNTLASTHAFFSAGDLLRDERKRNSPVAKTINDKISKGEFVPAEITVGLIKAAFDASDKNVFLLDGFPRNVENVTSWANVIGGSVTTDFILFLHCPEDVMLGRIIERGKSSGRNDDNLETARRRFENFRRETVPVVESFDPDMVKTVRSDRSADAVFKEVESLITQNLDAILA